MIIAFWVSDNADLNNLVCIVKVLIDWNDVWVFKSRLQSFKY